MKRLILFIIFLVSIVSVYGQRKRITDADRVIVRDSLNLNGEEFSISGASDNHILIRENGRWTNKNVADIDTLDIGDEQTLSVDSVSGQIGISIENGNRIHFKVGGAVSTDITLTGNGTTGNVLKVDTTKIATKYDFLIGGGYTDENARDAIGAALKSSGDVQFIVSDSGDTITANVKDDSHNHIISNVDNLQTTLDSKQATITGAATTVTSSNLAGNSVLISNSSGKIAVSPTISDTELSYLNGLTGNIKDNFLQFTDTLDLISTHHYVDSVLTAMQYNDSLFVMVFDDDTIQVERGDTLFSMRFEGLDGSGTPEDPYLFEEIDPIFAADSAKLIHWTDTLTKIATDYELTSKAPSNGSANYIQNRNSSAQTASFWINGTGQIDNKTLTVGDLSLKSVSVGLSAMAGLTTGQSNTAMGWETLWGNTTGSYNAAFGRHALFYAATNSGNTALGSDAMGYLAGDYNTALGWDAGHGELGSVSTGGTFVGKSAGHAAGTLTYPVMLGYHAGYGGSTTYDSDYDVFIGAYTAKDYIGGTGRNTIVGGKASENLTTGNNNVLLGYGAGGITSGNNNIIIGSSITAASATGNNQLKIGNYFTGDLSNGNITLGTVPGIGTRTFYTGTIHANTSGGNIPIFLRTTDYVANTSGTQMYMYFGTQTGDTYGGISVEDFGGLSNNNLVLQPHSGQRVLIGTTTDTSEKLQVNGTVKAVTAKFTTLGSGDVVNLLGVTNDGTLSTAVLIDTTDIVGLADFVEDNTPAFSQVYPGAGIPLSTGSGWGTSITNNSTNWNTAYADRNKWDGGSTGLNQSTALSSLGATTTGKNFLQISTISTQGYPQINSDNSISQLTATQLRNAIGAGTGNGTVTSVSMTVPTGLAITGSPITSSGTLAVSLQSGYSIPTNANQTTWNTAYTDRFGWDGGTSGLVAATGRTSLGGTTIGQAVFTSTNPGAIRFLRGNANNTVSWLSDSDFRSAIGAGTGDAPSNVNYLVGTANGTLTNEIVVGTTPGGVLGGTWASPTLDDNSINFAKLSTYNSAVEGYSLVYNSTFGLVWAARLSGSGSDGNIAIWDSYGNLADDSDFRLNSSTNALTVGSGDGDGSVTSGNFILSSDRRLKAGIQPIGDINWVDKINFKSFTMRSDLTQRIRFGVIAQEVEKVNENLVFTDENGYKSVGYIDLLIAKVARQDEIINELLKRIEKLENEK
jgi:hypothetical protein